MQVQSFRGLIPCQHKVAQIASVPYDVVDRDEAAALARGNPLSFLHVLRAEIGLPPEVSPYSDAVYAKANENLRNLLSSGFLAREPTPCIYIYRQIMGEHCQTGIALTCHIDDYERDVIRKHENTRPIKENDRTRLVKELNANPGPVFLTYRQTESIDQAVARITAGEPHFDFVASDGVKHTVWRVPGGEELLRLFRSDVPIAYVADGHHRSASAYRVGCERREANPNHDGSEAYNWFLAVLFPANQLRILPYNRVVLHLNGMSQEEFLSRVSRAFAVSETTQKEPEAPGQISMYLGGTWYGLVRPANSESATDPVSRLDVSLLQEGILAPLLGIDDPRTSEAIEFVGGIRGVDELQSLVDSGGRAVAFSMYPVTCDQLMAIADAGRIMPPKSTWFEPKLRSGLFVHTLD